MKGRIVRGSWQAGIFFDLEQGNVVLNPIRGLAGRARSYSGRYESSFTNLLARMRASGYTVIRCEGSKGGEWSAHYRCISRPQS